jgi:ABC-type Fe3+-hydroxamate transport system substrate-binding protein
MSPRSVADVGPAVERLADAVGAAAPNPFGAGAWSRWIDARRRPHASSAAVLIWRRPWTTLNAETYGSSVLDVLGVANVFAEEADRYPVTALADVAARRPDAVLLPSEPYPFSARHVPQVRDAVGGARIVLVDGRDLFWWGARTPDAVGRLAAALG